MTSEVSPLFDDLYLANRYQHGSGSKMDVVYAFLRRIRILLSANKYDLLVIEYELLPYFPALLERMLGWFNIRYIVDYDDALFHQYDHHRNPIIRKFLSGKISTVMRLSEAVVAGNAYLADYARRAGARRVEIIPTVINLDRYLLSASEKGRECNTFTIGWVGSPSTAKYLQSIAPALAEVCSDGNAKLRLIGSGPVELVGVDVEVVPWREESEVAQICRFDVGIMPLPDEAWARGKCGFKLIQYMACGLPVIASPVGVNSEIVEHGENGFLASTQSGWKQAVETMISDVELRKRMGVSGQSKVEERYCLQVAAPKLIKLFKSMVV